jgi:hypothetical protein
MIKNFLKLWYYGFREISSKFDCNSIYQNSVEISVYYCVIAVQENAKIKLKSILPWLTIQLILKSHKYYPIFNFAQFYPSPSHGLWRARGNDREPRGAFRIIESI